MTDYYNNPEDLLSKIEDDLDINTDTFENSEIGDINNLNMASFTEENLQKDRKKFQQEYGDMLIALHTSKNKQIGE